MTNPKSTPVDDAPEIDWSKVTWQDAVRDGRLNWRIVWRNQPVQASCPTCDLADPAKIYVADQHPIICAWMMANVHRCAEHDELLLPGEDGCPQPTAPDHWKDPHNRFTGRAAA